MNYFLISLLILYIYYFILGKRNKLTSPEDLKEDLKEVFTQLKDEIVKIKKEYQMYIGLKKPVNPEERCHPLQGDIGSIIDKAIAFCG
jgi:hypothetical protein